MDQVINYDIYDEGLDTRLGVFGNNKTKELYIDLEDLERYTKIRLPKNRVEELVKVLNEWLLMQDFARMAGAK